MPAVGLLKTTQNKWLSAVALLIRTAAFIIPLGWLQLSPINQSNVYYSQHAFSNQADMNAVWNSMSSLTQIAKMQTILLKWFLKKKHIILSTAFMHPAIELIKGL